MKELKCINFKFRNVLLTLEALKIPYELKQVNPLEGENRKPEYLKINPQHNVPAIKDGDFTMNESRAIMTYLASKVGNTKLYPTDVKTRARVDQRLYFDMGSFNSLGAIMVRENAKYIDPGNLEINYCFNAARTLCKDQADRCPAGLTQGALPMDG